VPSSIVRALRSDPATLKLKIARMMVMLQQFALCAGGVMALTSEEEKVLEAAVAGIPKVAEVVASIREEDRSRALDAVERSYRQTVLDLGYDEGPVQSWVSAVMLRLQREVKEHVKLKMQEALLEEVEQAESGPNNNIVEIKPGEGQ